MGVADIGRLTIKNDYQVALKSRPWKLWTLVLRTVERNLNKSIWLYPTDVVIKYINM